MHFLLKNRFIVLILFLLAILDGLLRILGLSFYFLKYLRQEPSFDLYLRQNCLF